MALGESGLSLLEGLSDIGSTPDKIQKTTLDRLNMFGIIRMLETTIINIDRIHILWDSVMAHLDCFANCKYPSLRALAVDAISCIILNVFMSSGKVPEESLENKDLYEKFWQKTMWQSKVLTPLLNCLKSSFPETVRNSVHNLPNLIEVFYIRLLLIN